MFKKIITIAKWEYLEKVKTRAFILSLIITPIVLVSVTILPSIIFRDESPTVEMFGVIDTSGIYYNFIDEEFQKYKLPDGQNNYVLLNLTHPGKSLDELTRSADKKVF